MKNRPKFVCRKFLLFLIGNLLLDSIPSSSDVFRQWAKKWKHFTWGVCRILISVLTERLIYFSRVLLPNQFKPIIKDFSLQGNLPHYFDFRIFIIITCEDRVMSEITKIIRIIRLLKKLRNYSVHVHQFCRKGLPTNFLQLPKHSIWISNNSLKIIRLLGCCGGVFFFVESL